MPYCSKCGVSVGSDVKSCPLCKVPIHNYDSNISLKNGTYPAIKYRESMSGRQKRFITWIIFTVIFITGFLTVLATNLLQSGNLSWAGYPMAAIVGTWLISTFILFLFKTPLLIIFGNFIVLSGMLALLDVIDGKLQWYLVLGLPILGIFTLAIVVLYLLQYFMERINSLFFSVCIFIIIAVCFGLNLLASAYLDDLKVSWALYVAISLGPLSVLLLLYHFWLRKVIDLKKVFHF